MKTSRSLLTDTINFIKKCLVVFTKMFLWIFIFLSGKKEFYSVPEFISYYIAFLFFCYLVMLFFAHRVSLATESSHWFCFSLLATVFTFSFYSLIAGAKRKGRDH